MSTARDIVRRALRALGVLASGKEPTGAMAADGLERLQSLILGLPGLLHNGHWREVATSAAYTACEGDRITVTSPGAVTLPLTVTRDGCTRPPMDLARVQILGEDADNAGLWIYSATKGAWGQADSLDIGDEIPFGTEDDEGLAAQLAINLTDEYGDGDAKARTVALATESARSLRARLKKAQPTDWSRPEPLGPFETCDDTFRDYR